LTVRAARLLRRADVIVYDALVNPVIVARARASATRIAVGKRAGEPGMAQTRINRLLITWSRQARVVVRLKGGDPFVFGRGGEEALALAHAGVRFRIVPGVTAALGAAAYAGIPLTQRELSSRVIIETGHASNESTPGSSCGETRVYYMPVAQLPEIVRRLLAQGVAASTPAALVESATQPQQRTLSAPLQQLPDVVRAAQVQGPALMIVGDVVRLREHTNWFEPRRSRTARRRPNSCDPMPRP
jgi:uroporphyrin-III C-methyltransferase